MKYFLLSFCFIIVLSNSLCQEEMKDKISSADQEQLYFGEVPPSTSPVLFAPGIISKTDRYEFGCTLSRNGKEFYFGVDNDGVMEIHYTSLKDAKWSPQKQLFENGIFGHNDPMLTPDENRLFFISNRPRDPSNPSSDIDIWYAERTENGWSEPINGGQMINNNLDQYFASFTSDGSLYYSSRNPESNSFDIFKSPLREGEFTTPQILSNSINTNRYEADVFIAPDESYIIFCSIRKNGLGKGDLYISFKNKENQWMEAVNMGGKINSQGHELCPFVTADGKYFFYTSNEDIYWVSTEIFNDYKEE